MDSEGGHELNLRRNAGSASIAPLGLARGRARLAPRLLHSLLRRFRAAHGLGLGFRGTSSGRSMRSLLLVPRLIELNLDASWHGEVGDQAVAVVRHVLL